MVVSKVAAALDALGVPYAIGGSLASSVYGVPRATQDVDLLADIGSAHIEPFVAAIEKEFYVDAEAIREAIGRRRSFNVIHLATMFKADIFVAAPDAWPQGELKRASLRQLEAGGTSVGLRFSSPEDTVLHKLVWYRLGEHVSDRQLSDVIGILKIQGQRLDNAYLEQWARQLGVIDLLERARRESK
jgi:hypothetical protein